MEFFEKKEPNRLHRIKEFPVTLKGTNVPRMRTRAKM